MPSPCAGMMLSPAIGYLANEQVSIFAGMYETGFQARHGIC